MGIRDWLSRYGDADGRRIRRELYSEPGDADGRMSRPDLYAEPGDADGRRSRPDLYAEPGSYRPPEQDCALPAHGLSEKRGSNLYGLVGDCLLYTSPSPRD